jgi:hypothetical protein
MLVPYQRKPGMVPDRDETIMRRLERELETARQQVVASGLFLTAEAGENNTYKLTLGAKNWQLDNTIINASCYPLSIKPAMARNMMPLNQGESLTFAGLSLAGLTVFLVVELEAVAEGMSSKLSMVLNLQVNNMPEGRDQAIVRTLMSNRSAFIRYLMLLLADDEEMGWLIGSEKQVIGSGSFGNDSYSFNPLLENMVKTLTRNPEKIDRVHQLVEEIIADPEGEKVLPEGFLDIWKAFIKIRRG